MNFCTTTSLRNARERYSELPIYRQRADVEIKRYKERAHSPYTYITHVAIPAPSIVLLDRIAQIFFRAAELEIQPWYSQFIQGQIYPCDDPMAVGVLAHHCAVVSFDLGLSKPRYYEQRVSYSEPTPCQRVIALESVDQRLPVPETQVAAFLMNPSGEVFEWVDQSLHWWHICTTAGVGLLVDPWDRWLLSAVRFFAPRSSGM